MAEEGLASPGSSMEERPLRKRRVAGSSPARGSKIKVAAEVGEDRAERIKRDEKSRGAEAPRGAGRVATDVRKGEA